MISSAELAEWTVDTLEEAPHSSHKKIALKRKIEEEKNEYLKKLIEIQDFEEAAIVRDEIKALKAESEVQHDDA